MDIQTKVKNFIASMNAKGVPLPMLRDPKSGVASVSLTMLFISFNVVLIGLLGKLAGKFGGIDIQSALYWFMVCAGLYFGRRVGDGKTELKGSTDTEDKA